ncbi:MAG: malto-oligosyltrehalose synthase [Verrucomicrobiae bacterium]|nr:malto-oligosyltrehalose synthase [Verrucomicrobiae bacterium]
MPCATYRLQFSGQFKFRDALELVPYLQELGITDLYASPYLRARSGSQHGYDVTDPNALNPELGSPEEHAALCEALSQRGMGQILDFVPNHMGIGGTHNVWWRDILENGRASFFADFFDIDWEPLTADPPDQGKVILPILGEQFGRVLENGEFKLAHRDGAFFVRYYAFELPLAPRSYAVILAPVVPELAGARGDQDSLVLELQSILSSLEHLPSRAETDLEKRKERDREKEVIKRRIQRLEEDCPACRELIDRRLRKLEGRAGDPKSFDELEQLLGRQAYRLAFWRVASEEINYRRFFDVAELAAIRMENPEVFAATHKLVLQLIGEGKVTGVRIDHPDGLWDPKGYFERLQASCPEPVYLLVEKILNGDERLRQDWPVQGTTGYDFLNLLNGVFVDRSQESFFDRVYSRFIGRELDYFEVFNTSQKTVMLLSLASEVNQLAFKLKRLARGSRRYRDFTLSSLVFVLREIIACLPVYRTYIDPERGEIGPVDRIVLESAVRKARRLNARTDPSIFEFVASTLLLRDEAVDPERRAARLQFIGRFQQCTGPVMAKGVEDTAFYRYNRLLSLNEVGGSPDRFGTPVETFHQRNAERLGQWPATMLATSTHDTKRGEDVRARLNVLSENPGPWRRAVFNWSRSNQRCRRAIDENDGRPAPDPNEEYYFYQTLVGAWPLEPMDAAAYETFQERIQQAMLKSLREAKVHTSWITPNEPYEKAVAEFIRDALDRDAPNPFLDEFLAFQKGLAFYGMLNSLSQTLLKAMAPGVPDFYQGSELFEFWLVDPDNRRPVDFQKRRAMLASLRSDTGAPRDSLLARLKAEWRSGAIKMELTRRALGFRRDHSELFAQGEYLPLTASGQKRNLIGFARRHAGQWALVVAPRFFTRLVQPEQFPLGEVVWGDTLLHLPPTSPLSWSNALTGEKISTSAQATGKGLLVGEVLKTLPVALLAASESS